MSVLGGLLRDIFKPTRTAASGSTASLPTEFLDTVEAMLNAGRLDEAHEMLTMISTENLSPQDLERVSVRLEFIAHCQAVKSSLPGSDYRTWLKWFHETLSPKTYLEIGVETGLTLALTGPNTLAIGIDPKLQVIHDQRAWTRLFQLTSDAFFEQYDPCTLFGTESLDFAFIDGLHTFDQALKDFIHLERYARKDSIILFHDVYPVIPKTVERERCSRLWLGDTWKVMAILKTHRPDLKMAILPTYPSGLGVVTHLDPHSTTLQASYSAIVDTMMPLRFDETTKLDTLLPQQLPNDFKACATHLGLSRSPYRPSSAQSLGYRTNAPTSVAKPPQNAE